MASDPWGESFSPAEQALLAPFVTSIEQPIFGLRGLPEVVKGALFSRYSRTDKSLRRVLLDEFLAPEAGLALPSNPQAEIVAVAQAEAFYERVLLGYGDDSVAELGGAHLACEGVSNVVAKLIEDSRLGISPLEKSTRYVPFDRQLGGQYRYYREPQIVASPHGPAYTQALDALFTTYTALLAPTTGWVRRVNPRDEATSERAYASATRAKALDLLRGLLPMATLTNLGLYGNGRAFEHLLHRLSSSPLAEAQAVAAGTQTALDALIPAFVKRVGSPRGQAAQQYRRSTRTAVQELVATMVLEDTAAEPPAVHLIEYDPDAESKVLTAILFRESSLSLEACRAAAERLAGPERLALLRAYVGERQARSHRPGRALEEPSYLFELLADLGAYRDLQRHRVLTQERQPYTARHGYITPPELVEAGLEAAYREALERAGDVTTALEQAFPEQAGYALPFAYRVRWRVRLNLREAYHLLELRSAPQGHPSYRRVAQEMFAAIAAVHPSLAEGMRFVDMGDYDLERLAAEQRLDQKLAARGDPTQP